jgi:hypothetical protein
VDLTGLAVSFLISGVGYVAFSYGKRMSKPPQLTIGLILMVFPYFIDSVWGMLSVAAALLALMVILVRAGW